MHRLGAEEFADRRAQHGAAVAHARVGRQAGALQLQFDRAVGAVYFAQQDGAAVAQLAGPDAELVAGIHGRQRLRAFGHGVAGQGVEVVLARQQGRVEAEQAGGSVADGHQIRRRQRRRHQPGVEGSGQGREGIVQRQFGGKGGSGGSGGSNGSSSRRLFQWRPVSAIATANGEF